ncbi:MAG: homoserine kinase [Myxococcales bacterium]|nr:homoserine kinase [Myxococcales bacterium]
MSDWLKVFAPATVANVGPGYDVLGLALDSPGDWVEAMRTEQRGVQIVEITGDDGRLPRVAALNCAGVSARLVQEKIDPAAGVALKVHKGMPIGSGLGSSSASSVAAAWATNLALGGALSKVDVLDACRAGEKLATGAPHADNVLPSLIGGITLIRSYEPFDYLELPTPLELRFAIVSPELEIKTADARKILPERVPMEDVVRNLGNVAALVAALYEGRLDLFGRALDDFVVVPYRSRLIQRYDDVHAAAMDAGALGCSISGSGPAMFAACTEETAEVVAAALVDGFQRSGIGAKSFIAGINTRGVRLVDEVE